MLPDVFVKLSLGEAQSFSSTWHTNAGNEFINQSIRKDHINNVLCLSCIQTLQRKYRWNPGSHVAPVSWDKVMRSHYFKWIQNSFICYLLVKLTLVSNSSISITRVSKFFCAKLRSLSGACWGDNKCWGGKRKKKIYIVGIILLVEKCMLSILVNEAPS